MPCRLLASTTTAVVVDPSNRTLPLRRPQATPTTRIPRRRRAPVTRATPSASKPGGTAKGFGSKKKNPTPAGTTPPPPWVADAAACPCCSGRKLDACCGPFLDGTATPETAEQLMRSRFAAYVRKDAAYVVGTTHPENPAAAGSRRPDGTVASSLAQDVAATIKRVAWQRLKVEAVEGGGRDDDEGFVTFTAWFKVTGQKGSRADGGDAVGTMNERSRFVRIDEEGGGGDKKGKWSYREGLPVINGVPRVLT